MTESQSWRQKTTGADDTADSPRSTQTRGQQRYVQDELRAARNKTSEDDGRERQALETEQTKEEPS